MGIKGLTSYVNKHVRNHSHQLFLGEFTRAYASKHGGSKPIFALDGDSVLNFIGNPWISSDYLSRPRNSVTISDSVVGSDPIFFHQQVLDFFSPLLAARVELVVYFDGGKGFDATNRKVDTWKARLVDRSRQAQQTFLFLEKSDANETHSRSRMDLKPDDEYWSVNHLIRRQFYQSLESLGVFFQICAGEADDRLAYLCKRGEVYAVITNDSDFLVSLGSRYISLSSLEKRQDRNDVLVTMIDSAELAWHLNLNPIALIDLAFILGCDINAEKCHEIQFAQSLGIASNRKLDHTIVDVKSAASFLQKIAPNRLSDDKLFQNICRKHPMIQEMYTITHSFLSAPQPSLHPALHDTIAGEMMLLSSTGKFLSDYPGYICSQEYWAPGTPYPFIYRNIDFKILGHLGIEKVLVYSLEGLRVGSRFMPVAPQPQHIMDIRHCSELQRLSHFLHMCLGEKVTEKILQSKWPRQLWIPILSLVHMHDYFVQSPNSKVDVSDKFIRASITTAVLCYHSKNEANLAKLLSQLSLDTLFQNPKQPSHSCAYLGSIYSDGLSQGLKYAELIDVPDVIEEPQFLFSSALFRYVHDGRRSKPSLQSEQDATNLDLNIANYASDIDAGFRLVKLCTTTNAQDTSPQPHGASQIADGKEQLLEKEKPIQNELVSSFTKRGFDIISALMSPILRNSQKSLHIITKVKGTQIPWMLLFITMQKMNSNTSRKENILYISASSFTVASFASVFKEIFKESWTVHTCDFLNSKQNEALPSLTFLTVQDMLKDIREKTTFPPYTFILIEDLQGNVTNCQSMKQILHFLSQVSRSFRICTWTQKNTVGEIARDVHFAVYQHPLDDSKQFGLLTTNTSTKVELKSPSTKHNTSSIQMDSELLLESTLSHDDIFLTTLALSMMNIAILHLDVGQAMIIRGESAPLLSVHCKVLQKVVQIESIESLEILFDQDLNATVLQKEYQKKPPKRIIYFTRESVFIARESQITLLLDLDDATDCNASLHDSSNPLLIPTDPRLCFGLSYKEQYSTLELPTVYPYSFTPPVLRIHLNVKVVDRLKKSLLEKGCASVDVYTHILSESGKKSSNQSTYEGPSRLLKSALLWGVPFQSILADCMLSADYASRFEEDCKAATSEADEDSDYDDEDLAYPFDCTSNKFCIISSAFFKCWKSVKTTKAAFPDERSIRSISFAAKCLSSTISILQRANQHLGSPTSQIHESSIQNIVDWILDPRRSLSPIPCCCCIEFAIAFATTNPSSLRVPFVCGQGAPNIMSEPLAHEFTPRNRYVVHFSELFQSLHLGDHPPIPSKSNTKTSNTKRVRLKKSGENSNPVKKQSQQSSTQAAKINYFRIVCEKAEQIGQRLLRAEDMKAMTPLPHHSHDSMPFAVCYSDSFSRDWIYYADSRYLVAILLVIAHPKRTSILVSADGAYIHGLYMHGIAFYFDPLNMRVLDGINKVRHENESSSPASFSSANLSRALLFESTLHHYEICETPDTIPQRVWTFLEPIQESNLYGPFLVTRQTVCQELSEVQKSTSVKETKSPLLELPECKNTPKLLILIDSFNNPPVLVQFSKNERKQMTLSIEVQLSHRDAIIVTKSGTKRNDVSEKAINDVYNRLLQERKTLDQKQSSKS